MNTCFILMPISDQEGYEKGHFTRVYQHLIKPACEKAGFKAIRADDEIKTNYIVIDIIRKILDSDIVICDLSSKNPNVLYELGLRQAFNKKSVLIKDNKTTRIFDIQGLRTVDYDENLRIDEVQKSINNIAKTLKETHETQTQDVNSLIQLLAIKPATIPNNLEISKESTLILDALNDISKRLFLLENTTNPSQPQIPDLVTFLPGWIGMQMYDGSTPVGELVDIHQDSIFLKKDNEVRKILNTDPAYKRIDPLPF